MGKIGKQGMDSGMAKKRPEIESYSPTGASQERIESRWIASLAARAYANERARVRPRTTCVLQGQNSTLLGTTECGGNECVLS